MAKGYSDQFILFGRVLLKQKVVDITFSVHHAFLEQPSSGTLKAKIFESQTHPFRNGKQIIFSIIRNITGVLLKQKVKYSSQIAYSDPMHTIKSP
jgi:hypothetical protein